MLLAEFDIMRMRDHLHNCIENMELTPFPKLRRKLKLRKQTEKVLNYSIAADCVSFQIRMREQSVPSLNPAQTFRWQVDGDPI